VRKESPFASSSGRFPKMIPSRKAISCYGLYLPQLDETWLRFVDGRPVSSITTQFLLWCCEKLEAAGKKVLLLIWDRAPAGT
jgi:hypothetical protein